MSGNPFPPPQYRYRLPVLALSLLWLGFALVGWRLTAQDIVWFMGIAIVVATIFFAWNSEAWLGGLLGYLPQILLIAFLMSVLVTLVAIVPLASTLIIIPVLTTYFAWQELQLLNFSQPLLWKILLVVILLGLGVGELVDLLLFPSPK